MDSVIKKVEEIDEELMEYINTHYYDNLSTNLQPGAPTQTDEHAKKDKKSGTASAQPRSIRWWKK